MRGNFVSLHFVLVSTFLSSLVMTQPPPPAAAASTAFAAQPAQAPVPRGAGLAMPVVVPPDFGGVSQDDCPTFIAHFNAACVVNGYALPACL